MSSDPFEELSDLYRRIVEENDGEYVNSPHAATTNSGNTRTDSTSRSPSDSQYDARFAALDEEMRQHKLNIVLLVRKARRFEPSITPDQVKFARGVLDLFKPPPGTEYDLAAVAGYMANNKNFETHQIGILIAYALTPAERALHFPR